MNKVSLTNEKRKDGGCVCEQYEATDFEIRFLNTYYDLGIDFKIVGIKSYSNKFIRFYITIQIFAYCRS